MIALAALVIPSTVEAFPRTKEEAHVVVSATLSPADPASTASGSASLEVTSLNGVQTVSPLEVVLTGVAAGDYTVAATKTSDGTSVPIGIVTVPAPTTDTGLALPEGLDPLDIATVSVSDATPAVVLSGSASVSIVEWRFAANVPVTSPATTTVRGEPKPKKVHGHVLIHAKIVNDVEEKRKFLLVAHGGSADTELTINLDGVAAGTVLTTKNGKIMAKELPGTVQLAGVGTMTLTDAAGVVVAQADFFPEVP